MTLLEIKKRVKQLVKCDFINLFFIHFSFHSFILVVACILEGWDNVLIKYIFADCEQNRDDCFNTVPFCACSKHLKR